MSGRDPLTSMPVAILNAAPSWTIVRPSWVPTGALVSLRPNDLLLEGQEGPAGIIEGDVVHDRLVAWQGNKEDNENEDTNAGGLEPSNHAVLHVRPGRVQRTTASSSACASNEPRAPAQPSRCPKGVAWWARVFPPSPQ